MNIDSTNAIDSLIAAQAKQENMILVTRNIKHYNKLGMDLCYFSKSSSANMLKTL